MLCSDVKGKSVFVALFVTTDVTAIILETITSARLIPILVQRFCIFKDILYYKSKAMRNMNK